MVKSLKTLGIVITIVSLSTALQASGGEGGSYFHWDAFLGKLVDSTILFGGLILVLRKPLIKVLSQKKSGY
jgi:hypothetical protein